ncbi:WD repeat-containing protein 38 isoform X3 [Oryctolagus cuniculus]|uniref:WD repeat-containing protein 38 isoform X3 n=1 Tax=Oryctolagus cuniculus TaxID=9986 RepID=UPI00048FE66A
MSGDPACCGPTCPEQSCLLWPARVALPKTPPRLRAPPPLPWRRMYTVSSSRPSCPERGPAGRRPMPMTNNAPGKLAVRRVKFFSQHHGEVNFSAFSPDGRTLLTASDDGCVYGWETRSGRLLWRLGGHTGPVKCCRFSPDGRLCASTSRDCTIRLWDVARAQCLRVLEGHQRSVETVSFSPDSKQLASGGWDKQVMLWEVQATGSWDSSVRIWDLRAGTLEVSHQELEGHRSNISCLCYSASGLLASGSWDKTIHIWKPATSSPLVKLKGHTTWVKSIAFSPDELWLASAGYSHRVKVWDCNTGKCLETVKGVLDVAHACAFTPDGKLLVSGAADQSRGQVHCSSRPARAPRMYQHHRWPDLTPFPAKGAKVG